MSYKKDNVEYVFACNYDNFNNEFKEKYNRDASEEDWNLFKEKFNSIRTDKIAEWFYIDITEIIDDNYEESDDDGYDGEDPHYADCSSHERKKCNCGAFNDDGESDNEESHEDEVSTSGAE
jgi:hypothetical protein